MYLHWGTTGCEKHGKKRKKSKAQSVWSPLEDPPDRGEQDLVKTTLWTISEDSRGKKEIKS